MNWFYNSFCNYDFTVSQHITDPGIKLATLAKYFVPGKLYQYFRCDF